MAGWLAGGSGAKGEASLADSDLAPVPSSYNDRALKKDLVQLVPTLPPAVSGVGDYATLLARELLAYHRVGTRFVVGDPGWRPGADADAPFPAAAVPARSARALLGALGGPGTVLLHYVSYGYAPRGCPFWLVDALERWRRAGPGRRLVVIFHEVYASGPPWGSAFWTSPFQRRLAARLARLADARRITTTISLHELRGTLRRAEKSRLPTAVAPVFSNLGEPAHLSPPAARERQVVVFGSPLWREAAYTGGGAAALGAFCARHGIGRVVDVGTPLAGGAPRLAGVEVEAAGVLPAPAAGALFARSLAGYFHYPAPHLGKSGIFAAYCAHGLVPVTYAANRAAADGLRAGLHYLAGDADDQPPLDAVAAAAAAWYGEHRLEVHARDVAALV